MTPSTHHPVQNGLCTTAVELLNVPSRSSKERRKEEHIGSADDGSISGSIGLQPNYAWSIGLRSTNVLRTRAWSTVLPLLHLVGSILVAVMIALSVAGCGGKTETSADASAEESGLPTELVSYRQARSTFEDWMKTLAPGGDPSSAYGLLSSSTRGRLTAAGVRNAGEFRTWFQRNRDLDLPPFRYRFSKVKIVDIDTRDSLRAIVTANFVVETPSARMESIGSFYLVRQRGAWRIPFGEGGDWERGWWQQERGFGARMRDVGMTAMESRALDLQILYPMTWDASDGATFRVPAEGGPRSGVELSYMNPVTLQKEAFVRIWLDPLRVPADTTMPMDTLAVIPPQPAVLTDAVTLKGETWRIEELHTGRVFHVFSGVNEAGTSYTAFTTAIRQIIASIKRPS